MIVWCYKLSNRMTFSGKITCYYELFDRDASKYEELVRKAIMNAWKFNGEVEGKMTFKEGLISNIKICTDFSINRAISQFNFSNVRELSNVAKLLKSILKNASLCNIFMNINGLTEKDLIEIENRIKKLKFRGLIEDPSTHSFRCDIILKDFSYSFAIYGEMFSADIIARFRDESEVNMLFNSIKSIIKPSVINRLFKGIK